MAGIRNYPRRSATRTPIPLRRSIAASASQARVDNDYLVTWDERQPDREDPTAADRQRGSARS
jgi:hypothetical protein